MKTITPILVTGLIVAAFLGGLFFHMIKPAASPQQLTLEQILSIRELHLVRHTYNDLFFLHRRNDPSKPIRAMVQVPVTITAYLNLKDVQLVFRNDTLTKVILPHAILHEPVYHVSRSTIRETRGFQLHAGKDLYPRVGGYLAALIEQRMDTTRNLAVANRILLQAEAEGKEYIKSMLTTLGYQHVLVTFNDEEKDKEVDDYIKTMHDHDTKPFPPPTYTTLLDAIPFGFLPLPQ